MYMYKISLECNSESILTSIYICHRYDKKLSVFVYFEAWCAALS